MLAVQFRRQDPCGCLVRLAQHVIIVHEGVDSLERPALGSPRDTPRSSAEHPAERRSTVIRGLVQHHGLGSDVELARRRRWQNDGASHPGPIASP